ncbi:AlpA family phage regulatory protein [Silvimonas soli]|uniref:AlpA family phage regulatory protein n=1 Tax=Silvimonas soli TaxID=2980100 RepID=UPI0024B391F9|nr:AlpA family phage regulatory protein [Silvimonas soli]
MKLLRLKAVIALTTLSKSSIYEKLDPASRYYDQTFPQRVLLGARSVAWREDDIHQWIGSRTNLPMSSSKTAFSEEIKPLHSRGYKRLEKD